MVSSAVNRGEAGAFFTATEATGEIEPAAFLFIVAVMGRVAARGFMTEGGFTAGTAVGAVACATLDAGGVANAACLNSTDFKFPRVVMIGPFLPKRFADFELGNWRCHSQGSQEANGFPLTATV